MKKNPTRIKSHQKSFTGKFVVLKIVQENHFRKKISKKNLPGNPSREKPESEIISSRKELNRKNPLQNPPPRLKTHRKNITE